jgi:hypothetical protein
MEKKMEDTRRCKQCAKELPEDKHGNTKFCGEQCFNAFYHNYHEAWNLSHPNIEKDYTKNGVRAYNNIKQRTGNPRHKDYANYGARNIKLEITLEEFLAIYFRTNTCENCGVALDHNNRNAKNGTTLDRIDQTLGYCKGNLRILCRSCNSSLSYRRRGVKK